MGKNTRGQKEYSREQELKYENAKLRREISSLRRQIARLDIDRYVDLREMVEKQINIEENEARLEAQAKKMQKAYPCFSCNNGHLEILKYPKADGIWYYRECSNSSCMKRTKSQRYSDKVEGIISKKSIS